MDVERLIKISRDYIPAGKSPGDGATQSLIKIGEISYNKEGEKEVTIRLINVLFLELVISRQITMSAQDWSKTLVVNFYSQIPPQCIQYLLLIEMETLSLAIPFVLFEKNRPMPKPIFYSPYSQYNTYTHTRQLLKITFAQFTSLCNASFLKLFKGASINYVTR